MESFGLPHPLLSEENCENKIYVPLKSEENSK